MSRNRWEFRLGWKARDSGGMSDGPEQGAAAWYLVPDRRPANLHARLHAYANGRDLDILRPTSKLYQLTTREESRYGRPYSVFFAEAKPPKTVAAQTKQWVQTMGRVVNAQV